ncbi:MAG: DMT family transporter [Rhodothermales bacterium]|nr:DMT family transporter [Rhodothermales bacterium]
MEKTRRPARVYALLALGLLSISISPILIKYSTDAPALSVAAWRTIFAFLFLLPFSVRSAIPQLRSLDRTGILLTVIAGVFLGAHFTFWIESLYYTSVASAATLVSLSPLFLAILGFVLLGERLRRLSVFAIFVAVGGAIIIGLGDTSAGSPQANPLLGNALAFVAAFLVSLYLLIGRAVRKRLSWLPYVFGMYTVVMIVIVGAALIGGAPLLGLSTKTYVLCALMGLIPQIIGHGSFNYAVKYFDASFLGLLTLFEPVAGSVYAFILFSEIPLPLSAVGLITVLVGLVLGIMAQRS